MTPFMQGPLVPWNTYDDPIYEIGRRHDAIYERPLKRPSEHIRRSEFTNWGADMTPFMKGPLGAPEHERRSNL